MRDPWQVGEVDVDAYTEQDDCPSGDARPYTHCREEEEGLHVLSSCSCHKEWKNEASSIFENFENFERSNIRQIW